MARPQLSERRRAQTRLEIAESALELFLRDGYDAVGVEAIAKESGMSLRTFYRYFASKEEVLAPVFNDGVQRFADALDARPAEESLVEAVRAVQGQLVAPTPQDADRSRATIALLLGVPALRARWIDDLRRIEELLVPVVRRRTGDDLSELHVRLIAASVVLAIRIPLELSATGTIRGTLDEALDWSLRRVAALIDAR